MSRFDEFSKHVELVDCSYNENNFDADAGYVCPNIDVEMNVYGTEVSFVYNQENDENDYYGGLIIRSDDNAVRNEVENFLKDNADDLRDLIEDSDEYHAAIDKYDRMFSNAMANREAIRDDDFDREDREYDIREVAYEDDRIKISETGRDYDTVAIIENKTDEEIVLFVDGDYEFARIDAGDYIGLTNDRYDELSEFLSYDSVEVKTADEMEQKNNALVNKYKYGIDR